MKKKKLNLGRIVKKAARGYKKKMEKETAKNVQMVPAQMVPQVIHIKEKEEIKEEKPKEEGISLVEKPGRMVMEKKEEEDLTRVNLKYALIPRGSSNPYAWVNIKWSVADSSLVYYVVEPKLDEREKKILNKIKDSLVEKLDIDFTTLKKGEAKEYLIGKFREMVALLAKPLSAQKQEQILYFIERDFIGMDKIEPIMQDPDIEDISCDGVGIPIYIYHRNPTIGSIRTNVKFDSGEELDIFVNKLAQRCGKSISIASPLLGGALPDGSRVQSTLGTDISRRGSNFTIRKFTKDPLTPVHMIKFKTMDEKILAYFWLLIEYGRSILVSGSTATGKTSLLNALSLFINPNLKVVSIEDTPELQLPLPHWLPQVARTPIAEIEGRKVGEVDLFDLLRESLRQRPDYLIVGEVRGKEAYVLFQQMATGHPALATIHANSIERLVNRLTTAPISLPANLLESLDIIIFLVRIKYKNTYVRKISNIYEIIGHDEKTNKPITNKVFTWNAGTNKFEAVNPSIIFKRISKQYGINENLLKSELARREKVLKWSAERDITDYRDFAKIIRLYYTRAEDLLSSI